MGGDEQFESLVQLRNTSKLYKLVCVKYKQIYAACFFSGLIRLLFKSPTQLSKTVIAKLKRNILANEKSINTG